MSEQDISPQDFNGFYAKSIVDAVPLLLSYCDRNLVYHFVNKKYRQWFNKSKEEIIGKTVPEILGPIAYQQIKPYIDLALEGKRQVFEADVHYKDGTNRHVHVTYTPDIDTNGVTKGLFVSVGDITNYYQSEQDLANLQIRHDLALRGLSVGVWDWDVQTNELAWSYRFKEIVGVSEETFRPHFNEFSDRLHPDDREATLKAVEAHLTQQVPYDVEYRLKHNQGHYVWIRAQGQALWNKEGDPVRMVGSVDDISERKLAEQKLLERETYLDALIENIPSMIFVKDAENLRFTQFNKAGEKLIGIKRDRMIGKSDYDFFPEAQADFFTSADRKVLKSGNLKVIEEEEIETTKGTKVLRTTKVPLTIDNKKKYLLGISEDITERKKSEAEIKRFIEELSNSNSALEQFAHVVSHDLREPLRGIYSCTQLLSQRLEKHVDDSVDPLIDAIQTGVNRMTEMIDGLLSYSKLRTHSIPFKHLDCNEILSFAQENLSYEMKEMQTTIVYDPLPQVSGDRIQLIQLFQNLISNAIKYHRNTPIQVRITARLTEDQQYWLFSVEDNGKGIDSPYLTDIFTIFKRLENRTEYPGTGIGLAICKQVVENHRGKIWAESELGKGTTFFFTLPVETSTSA